MGIWYTQGTASCENGSTSVTGLLTAWNNQVKLGDSFRFVGDTEVYQIAADATANTALTFVRPYAGTSKVGAPFEIIPVSVRRQDVPTLWYRVDQMLNKLTTLVNTTGKPADSFGADGTLAIDKAARLMYQKDDGHWDNGTSLGGPGYGGISTNTIYIGTNEKTFTIGDGFAYVANSRVRAIAIGSSPVAWLEGNITSYDDGNLIFTPDRTKGIGTYSNWLLTLTGDLGFDGWSPITAYESDGARIVQQVVDWQGGTGSKPATGKYIGASGFVDAKGDAVDVRGAPGSDGVDGWTPVFATVNDDDRRVLQVADWIGGEGTKPATGKYVGPTTLVDDIAEAVDIRGPIGPTGPASIIWAGEYDDETTYHLNDVVQFEKSSWQTLQTTVGHTPPSLPTTENAYFSLLAGMGDQGDPGDPGTPGTDGADGTNFQPDEVGTFAGRDTYDEESAGFVYLSLDGDGDAITTSVLFFKQAGSGNWSDPVLFQGPVGPAGVVWRGDYGNDIEYNQNDGVFDQGGSWRAKQASVGNDPPTLPTYEDSYWKLISRPGQDGVTSYNDLTDKPTLGTAAPLDIDTDGTLAANSDSKIATQKAVKTYADQIIAAADAMVFSGVVDCSTNPNYPAADRGHTYRVSVAGKIGGGSGVNVENGDLLLCLTDSTASGNHATVGANWNITQANIDGAVVGPATSTDNAISRFDNTTGKLIQNSLATIDDAGRLDCIRLTYKLAVDISGTDLNGVIYAGFYQGNNLTNSPGGSAANFYVEVQTLASTTNYCVQLAIQLDGAGGAYWQRQQTGAGAWGSWIKILSTRDLDTDGALTANSDAKVASQKATKTYADTKIAKTPTAMTSPDVDTITTSGLYRISGTPTNVPSGFTFAILSVCAAADYGYQIISKSSGSEFWIRYGGSLNATPAWGSWQRLWHDGDFTLDTDGTLAANSDTRVSSQKAVKTYVAAQIASSGRSYIDAKLDYGVAANGTTDDTTAMQNAINAAISSGKALALPAGAIKITSALTVNGAVFIYGQGATKTLIRLNTATQYGINVSTTSPCYFSDFCIEMQSGVTATAGGGIIMDPGGSNVNYQSVFRGMRFVNTYQGIIFQRAAYWEMHGCTTLNCVTNHLLIRNLVNDDEGDSTISDCMFTYNAGTPTSANLLIVQNSSGGLKINNCKITGGYRGYHGAPATGVDTLGPIITGNSFENQTDSCIFLGGPSDTSAYFRRTVITGNEIASFDNGYGIRTVGVTNKDWLRGITITGNAIATGINGGGTGANKGIYMDYATAVAIAGNVLDGQAANGGAGGSVGIHLTANVVTAALSGNVIKNYATATTNSSTA